MIELENRHGLTLGTEAKVRLVNGIRPVLEPEIAKALGQDAAVARG